MATSDRDLIGLHAFSSDGAKLGRVKEVLETGGRTYLVIHRSLSKDLIVPTDGARRADVRVDVGYENLLLERAPQHEIKGEPTADELARIDQFYDRAA